MSLHLPVSLGEDELGWGVHPPSFSVSLSIIHLKKELVKCRGICALSAPSSLVDVMIICKFFAISGGDFLRIYK